MKELFFATHNKNKAKEIEQMLGGEYTLRTLDDAGVTADIPETATTLEGNALIKARLLHELTGNACFADDTGLEVTALGGAPGVYTARYAGEECDPQKNMAKLIAKMKGADDRSAQFRTVIAYISTDGEEILFEGVCPGTIATTQQGTEGFGYDPIFIPEGQGGRTFAEMPISDKNKISHRGIAVGKFIQFIKGKQ